MIEAALLARADAELNHIGSNLNQTTRALNEFRLIALESGNNRLAGLIDDTLEMNEAALRDLAVTLAVMRAAAGYDREG